MVIRMWMGQMPRNSRQILGEAHLTGPVPTVIPATATLTVMRMWMGQMLRNSRPILAEVLS
jgi:hypothetical protein